MLSRNVKKRIARNKKLRSQPKWVQKVEMYRHQLMDSVGSAAILSTKHILDDSLRAQAQAQNNERIAERDAMLAKLDGITREGWAELETTLPIEARWTPLQMWCTVRASGGYRNVIEAHGGYRQKISPKLTQVKQADIPAGNWDNPATLNDSPDWEAEHEDREEGL
jgi:D-alanyl-D-alanine carboxypeptidase